ncbi:MAG: hypothetical protein FWG20_01540 [Candidatus Cloacimonetes bacterium]|nr:hypothetical protein [Candidatus Cloacimonadota bacterium]
MQAGLQQIAKKIIHDIFQIKPGQSVIIFAEIHNISEPAQPLEEIPLLEELAITLRKHNAIPIIDISTENLHQRFFKEIDSPDQTSQELFDLWINSADFVIDLSWRSNPLLYKSVPEKSLMKYCNLSDSYLQEMGKKNKKIILLGTPTKGLAKYYNLDHNTLKETYLSSINADYFTLKKKCLIFGNKIKHNEGWKVRSAERVLAFDLIGTAKNYYGEFKYSPVLVLPTGLWQQNIEPSKMTGILMCDFVYHSEYVWSDVQLIFREGKVVDIEIGVPQENTKVLKINLRSPIKSAILGYGINYFISKMTFYSLYDISKSGNLSITLHTENHEVILMLQNAQLYQTEDNIISD